MAESAEKNVKTIEFSVNTHPSLKTRYCAVNKSIISTVWFTQARTLDLVMEFLKTAVQTQDSWKSHLPVHTRFRLNLDLEPEIFPWTDSPPCTVKSPEMTGPTLYLDPDLMTKHFCREHDESDLLLSFLPPSCSSAWGYSWHLGGFWWTPGRGPYSPRQGGHPTLQGEGYNVISRSDEL